MATATVQYSEGQIDEEGQPVSTEPFDVEFDENEQGWEGDRPESIEEKIAYTGDVQFGWELLAVK